MSDFNRGYAPATADMSVDAGLRGFMLGVYNKLAIGLVISAALAYLTSIGSPVRDALYVVQGDRLVGITLLGTIVRYSPFAVILFSLFAMRNPTPRSSGLLYWAYVLTIGAGAGVWMLIYTGGSVLSAFLATAVAFGSLSLFGYTTKKNLTGMGNFLMMGLIGILVAMLINIFVGSSAITFAINVLGVLIFAGLTAYDTQNLKMTYYALGGDKASMGVATNYGALNLYLNFVNMFQFLLSLFGSRR